MRRCGDFERKGDEWREQGLVKNKNSDAHRAMPHLAHWALRSFPETVWRPDGQTDGAVMLGSACGWSLEGRGAAEGARRIIDSSNDEHGGEWLLGD